MLIILTHFRISVVVQAQAQAQAPVPAQAQAQVQAQAQAGRYPLMNAHVNLVMALVVDGKCLELGLAIQTHNQDAAR